jgi:hypothetical protein
MPPAFNLSQDQTLQLILLAPALLPEPITSCFTQSKRGLLLYEHLILEALASPQRKSDILEPAPSYQAPTLIGCEFLKSVCYGLRCCRLPLRKQMGSGVLDAAAASETKIMKYSATPCKV